MDAVEAEYPSKCAACGSEIKPGDMVVKEDGGDWIHEDCQEPGS